MSAATRWHRCPDCEVCWVGGQDECWSCGRMVRADPAATPFLTSQHSPVKAFTDAQWRAVRSAAFGQP